MKLLDDFPEPKIPKEILQEVLKNVEVLDERDTPPEPDDRDPAERLVYAMLEGEITADEATEMAEVYGDLQDAREPSLAEVYLEAQRTAEDEDEENGTSE